MVTHARDDRRLINVEVIGFARDEAFNAMILSAHGSHALAEPNANPYALEADTLHFLREMLDRVQPMQIVEFGSGASTRLFAAWASAHDARHLSFEHDGVWANKIRSEFGAKEIAATTVVHAPLVLERHGLRFFLTYQGLSSWANEVQKASLMLLDGPHMAGREVVLYFAMNNCPIGGIIIIDDFNLYGVRDMLASVPKEMAKSFDGVAIVENSHGLYVLRRKHSRLQTKIPFVGVKAALRSCWRCFRDYRTYGTGRL